MKTRALGASGLQLSVLGMGCWQYGGGSYWGEQSQKDVDLVVHRALDMGINYFDTAEVYNEGKSEISLGIALKGRREQAIIGSKISTAHARPEEIKRHCEASLTRMQTDYIDMYMLHWPLTAVSVKHFSDDEALIANLPSVSEVFDGLNMLKQEGKIRHIGISNHGLKQMDEVLATGVSVAANELAYSLFSRAIEAEVIPYCAQHQIGVIGYMPLQQGLLTGKFASLDEVRPMQARSRHFHHSRGHGTRHGEEGAEAEMNAALLELAAVAKELGVSMGTLSLAWAIANEHICSTIVGSRNLEQLEMNAGGAAYELSADAVSHLNRLTAPVLAKLGNNPDYYENRNGSRVV
ncbi:aldo/keto reductase [Paenibacillus xerothermodurans]|uniref:Aldo/keto reductase n=1 Tax=Paenibacillus xerothermodurans TaxID=1977292 RepID=A0A2W1NF60_PAEXE|nr:aldo/keto reductase [Paenibacillus xerothermodurans]PZE22320.1 aldo/keto reductase [Paenibacillus xerothermodurans]